MLYAVGAEQRQQHYDGSSYVHGQVVLGSAGIVCNAVTVYEYLYVYTVVDMQVTDEMIADRLTEYTGDKPPTAM